MKKTISIVFAALLLAVSLLPLLGLLFFGSGDPAANERLSAAPRLRSADGTWNESVLNELSDFFADHFALRREAATAWATIKSEGLHSSAERQVVLGSQGWLYFAETLDDYRGIGLADAALRETARDLALIQEAASAQGAEMLFVIAPNKNSLYPGHMPRWIENGHAGSNAARLMPLLAEYGVRSADLFAAFTARDEILYYRTDSHWTGRGAALAADAILEELGRSSDFFTREFISSKAHTGDLYVMLYPRGRETEDDLQPIDGFAFRSLNDPRGGEAITIRTENAAGEGSLYCWRDSFGISLYPYLAESFATSVFSRSEQYDLSGKEAREADVLVLELVERNLERLWRSPAIYPAPIRTLSAEKDGEESYGVSFEAVGTEGLIRLTVVVPSSLRDAGSEVVFSADGTFYEAAVCAAETEDEIRVTACVPETIRPDGLIVLKDGVRTFYSLTTEAERG